MSTSSPEPVGPELRSFTTFYNFLRTEYVLLRIRSMSCPSPGAIVPKLGRAAVNKAAAFDVIAISEYVAPRLP
jgi:hypothetical protein